VYISSAGMATFSIPVNTIVESELLVQFNISSGSALLYVAYNRKPTQSNYDAVESRPTVGNHYRISLSSQSCSPKPLPRLLSGIWWIGIRSNSLSSVTGAIELITSATCPSHCGDHGSCVLAEPLLGNRTCACEDGFTGPYCGNMTNVLEKEGTVASYLDNNCWLTLRINMGSARNAVVASLRIVSLGGDADAYFSFRGPPSLLDYDAKLSDSVEFETITVTTPEPLGAMRVLYVAVHAASAAQFQLTLNSTLSCTADCSYHGMCRALPVENLSYYYPTCVCDADHRGKYCQERIKPLAIDEVTLVKMRSRAWYFFPIEVSTGDRRSHDALQIRTTEATAHGSKFGQLPDTSVFVRWNNLPSRTTWDQADRAPGPGHELVLSSLTSAIFKAGRWYTGIYAYSDSAILVTTSLLIGCPMSCSAHGSCHALSRTCLCWEGFSGQACEENLSALESENSVSGYASIDTWNHWRLDVRYSTDFVAQVVIAVNATRGLPDLYISISEKPTLKNFYRRVDHSTESMRITFQDEDLQDVNAQDLKWWVSIYGFTSTAYTLDIDIVQDSCQAFQFCPVCLANLQCGWCQDRCMAGAATGPTKSNCLVEWHTEQCPLPAHSFVAAFAISSLIVAVASSVAFVLVLVGAILGIHWYQKRALRNKYLQFWRPLFDDLEGEDTLNYDSESLQTIEASEGEIPGNSLREGL
jgi:hypothetical protein